MKAVTRVGILLCLALGAGCGDSTSEEPSDPQDAGAMGEADAAVRCGDDVPPFALGMTAVGDEGHVKAVLRAAQPEQACRGQVGVHELVAALHEDRLG